MRKDGPQPRLSRTRLGSRGWHSGGRDSRAHPFVGTAGNWFWAPKNCALRSRPCRRGHRAAGYGLSMNMGGRGRRPNSQCASWRELAAAWAQRPAFGYPCPAPAFFDGERRPRTSEGGMGAGAPWVTSLTMPRPAHKASWRCPRQVLDRNASWRRPIKAGGRGPRARCGDAAGFSFCGPRRCPFWTLYRWARCAVPTYPTYREDSPPVLARSA
jgi:hypothetical protein